VGIPSGFNSARSGRQPLVSGRHAQAGARVRHLRGHGLRLTESAMGHPGLS
jgi:hypothetical protein